VRLKNHAHWWSDVIAGWALGTAVGYCEEHLISYAHDRGDCEER
jgi:hypothetical protein